MERNQKGFSLLELVVVIAILAVVSAGLVTIFLTTSGWRCEKAAKLIDGKLSETRTLSLSKTIGWMELTYQDGAYVIITSDGRQDRLTGDLKITYLTTDNNTEEAALDVKGHRLILSFARGSGAFLGIQKSRPTNIDGTVTYDTALGADLTPLYCTKIIITKGDKYHYSITLYQETGRHTITKE